MPLDWGGGQSANFTWGHVIPYMQGTCSREILGFHMDESYIVYMSFYYFSADFYEMDLVGIFMELSI